MLLCFHTTLCSKLCQHNSPRPKGGALVVAHLRRLDVPVNLIRPRHPSNNTLGEGERGLSPRPLLPPSNINHHLNLPCSRWLQWRSIVQPSSSLKHVVVAWKHLSMMHTHVLNTSRTSVELLALKSLSCPITLFNKTVPTLPSSNIMSPIVHR